MTRRPAVAMLLVLVWGCTSGCVNQAKAGATATLRVHAHLTSTRPTTTGSTTLHVPLREYAVRAIRGDGEHVESVTDQDGLAVLHLEPGDYAVTAPSAGCVTKSITLASGEVSRLRLTCLAP